MIRTNEFESSPSIPVWPLLVMLLVLLLLAVWFIMPIKRGSPSPLTVIPAGEAQLVANYLVDEVKVTNGIHSVAKHLDDARQIHKCLDGPNNVFEVWKFTSFRRPKEFFQICQLDDARYGLRLIEKRTDGNWYERTSFIVKNGTYEELYEYLTARAGRFLGKLSTFGN